MRYAARGVAQLHAQGRQFRNRTEQLWLEGRAFVEGSGAMLAEQGQEPSEVAERVEVPAGAEHVLAMAASAIAVALYSTVAR